MFVLLLLLAAAKGKPEDALEWALKISTETTKLTQLSVKALHAVLAFVTHTDGDRVFDTDGDRVLDTDNGDGLTLEVHWWVAVAMFECKPDNSDCRQNVVANSCGRALEIQKCFWYLMYWQWTSS
jgi:hypothetical protein